MSLFTNDWQLEWGWTTAQSDFSTPTSADSEYGSSLAVMDPPGTGRRAISNAPAGSVSDPEILGLVRAPTTDFANENGYCRLYVCGGGDSSTNSEYAYYVAMHTGNWRLVEYDGSLTSLGTARAVSENEWWWARLRAETTGTGDYDLFAKFWKKENSEPSSWDITATRTPTNITTSGWVGIGGFPSYRQEWDWVGIADSGNSVPVPSTGLLDWKTESDWDNAQAQTLGHHASPTGTNWAAADTFEAGYNADFSSFGANIIGYYPLTETSGSTAYDISGKATDGTYSSTTLSNTTGPFGRNYPTFDATNSRIDTGTTFTGSGGDVAICAWFKIPSYTTSWQTITNSYDGNVALSLQRNSSNNELSFNVNGSSSSQKTAISYTPDDQWRWFYGHRDSANSEQLARLDNTVNKTGTAPLETSTKNHYIGSDPNNSSNWNGELAHVMYFDGPLTSSEQDEIYNAPY